MSSLAVTFARAFGSAFVPHDGLYNQAAQLIKDNDVDGDGVLDLADPAQRDKLGLAGLKGFELADSLGWNNNVVSVRELRKGLQRYDTNGDPATGGPDGTVDGVEWLRIVRDALTLDG